LGAATADPDAWILGWTVGEGLAIGGLFGSAPGAVIGGITALFKKSRVSIINGDINKWIGFKNYILEINNRNR